MKKLFEILPHIRSEYGNTHTIMAAKENGCWVKYNIDNYENAVNQLSHGLISLGVQQGDNIATISDNRPEWNMLDMAILQVGAVHVPIFPNLSEDNFLFILNHAEIKILFIEKRECYERVKKILAKVNSLCQIYFIEEDKGFPNIAELQILGGKNADPKELNSRKNHVKEDDTATIMYTSGTTGNPKGVMLTHKNILHNASCVIEVAPLGYKDRVLSFLPLCHSFERTMNISAQIAGVSIYYAESLATIGKNMQEIKPHAIPTVPRLLEKIYDKIIMEGRKFTGIKKYLFYWSLNLGLRYEFYGANGRIYELKLAIARKLVFSKWRQIMGNELKIVLSAGAALQPRLMRLFNAANIPIINGYGLTETSPGVCNTTLEDQKIGTVGKPIRDVNVKIAEDGEVLVKGPNVMKGYYKEPELDAEIIDKDGWLHTGDIGHFEKGGYLKITGRRKEVFKLSNGKFISPDLFENKLKESPFVENVIVIGENRKFASALVIPDYAYIENWSKLHEIPFKNMKDLIENKEINSKILSEIQNINCILGKSERIYKFRFCQTPWTIEKGELTPTLKVKRDNIQKNYKHLIEEIYK